MEQNVKKAKRKPGSKALRSHVERVRFIIQSLFFILTNSFVTGFLKGTIYKGNLKYICVPGLNCYSCPGAVGSCPIGALQAIFNTPDFGKSGNGLYAPLYYIPFYLVGMLMVFGVICGRLICGLLCPFGLVQDLIYKIPLKKIKKVPGDKYLRYLKYGILVVFVILLPMLFGIGNVPYAPWFCKYICPSGTLIGGIPLMTIGGDVTWEMAGSLTVLKLSILFVLLVLSIFIYRPFCKYLCPLGAIYSFFNKVSFYKFYVDESKCNRCNGKASGCSACKTACRMGVDIVKTPNSLECIRCGDCKAACPNSAIVSGFKQNPNLKRDKGAMDKAETTNIN